MNFPRLQNYPVLRISAALAILTLLLVMLVDMFFNILPNEREITRGVRQHISQNLAMQFVPLIQQENYALVLRTMRSVMLNDPSILSIAARRDNGLLVAQVGDHMRHWATPQAGHSTLTHIQIPVNSSKGRWGTIEFSYRPVGNRTLSGWFTQPMVVLVIVLGLGGMLMYYFFMRRILEHLDPSAVIPERVKRAFDSLTEGLLVLDGKGRIVLVNAAFTNLLPQGIEKLALGQRASELEWLKPGQNKNTQSQPWDVTLEKGKAFTGVPIDIDAADGGQVRTLVNCSPIFDDAQKIRGCLVTFDDITELYSLHDQLTNAMDELQESHRLVEEKNMELSQLAMQDPLTGCYNRRALYDRFGPLFEESRNRNHELCCLMADIDFFKRVNDTHGHAVGDQVIIAVAKALSQGLRPTDVVARYGGEEYCVLLPNLTLAQAVEVSDRIRQKIEADGAAMIEGAPGLKITASFGISTIKLGAPNYQSLIDQADQALYAAKQAGRNRVISFDQCAQPAASSTET